MFSPLIQGYIDQGGKEAAMQRVQSIRAHVANIEKQLNPEAVKTEQKTFAEILKARHKIYTLIKIDEGSNLGAIPNFICLFPTFAFLLSLLILSPLI